MPTLMHCVCDPSILLLSHAYMQTSVYHTQFDLWPTCLCDGLCRGSVTSETAENEHIIGEQKDHKVEFIDSILLKKGM